MKTQTANNGIALPFILTSALQVDVWVVNAIPQPLNPPFPPMEPRYSLQKTLGGYQDQSERVQKISPIIQQWF